MRMSSTVTGQNHVIFFTYFQEKNVWIELDVTFTKAIVIRKTGSRQ